MRPSHSRRHNGFYFFTSPPLTLRHPTSTARVARKHVAHYDPARNGDDWPAAGARSAGPANSAPKRAPIMAEVYILQ